MFIGIFCIAATNILAQGNQGNNGQGKLWEKNNATGNIYNTGLTNFVGIGTDTPQYPLEVNGKIVADSLHILKNIKIGNSIWLGGISQPGISDEIYTDDWHLYIQCNPSYNYSTIFNALGQTGSVGIGADNPGYKLEVNNDINLTSSVHNQGYRIGGDVVLQKPGPQNIFVGEGAGINNNATAGNNSYVGFNSGNSNVFGWGNSFFGSQAGYHNTGTGTGPYSGTQNTFIGNDAGYSNTDGGYNTFVGANAGRKNIGNGGTLGVFNTFIGHAAGYENVSGSYNVMLGRQAGLTNISGNNNTFLGYSADCLGNLSNASAIGNLAYVTSSNCLVLGSISGLNNATQTVKVGIGTAAPTTRLEVQDATAVPGYSGLINKPSRRFTSKYYG